MYDSNICPACEELRCACAKIEKLEEMKDAAFEALDVLRSAYDKCYSILEQLDLIVPDALEDIRCLLDETASAIEYLETEPDEETEREDTK